MIREERLLKVLRAPHVSEKHPLRWKKQHHRSQSCQRRDQSRNQSCSAETV